MEKQGASSVLVTSAHPPVPGHGGPDSKAIRGLRNLKISKHKQTTNLALGANEMDHELGPRGKPKQMAGQINAPIGRPHSRGVPQEYFFKKLLLENVRKTGMKQGHCEGPKVPPASHRTYSDHKSLGITWSNKCPE